MKIPYTDPTECKWKWTEKNKCYNDTKIKEQQQKNIESEQKQILKKKTQEN